MSGWPLFILYSLLMALHSTPISSLDLDNQMDEDSNEDDQQKPYSSKSKPNEFAPVHVQRLYDAYRVRLKGEGDEGEENTKVGLTESKDPAALYHPVVDKPKDNEDREKAPYSIQIVKYDATVDRPIPVGKYSSAGPAKKIKQNSQVRPIERETDSNGDKLAELLKNYIHITDQKKLKVAEKNDKIKTGENKEQSAIYLPIFTSNSRPEQKGKAQVRLPYQKGSKENAIKISTQKEADFVNENIKEPSPTPMPIIKYDATDDKAVPMVKCLAKYPDQKVDSPKDKEKSPSVIVVEIGVPNKLQVTNRENSQDPGDRRIFELSQIYNEILKTWRRPEPVFASQKTVTTTGSVKLSALSDLLDVVERLEQKDLVEELAKKINEKMEPDLKKQMMHDAHLVTDSRASLRAISKNDLSGIFENMEPGSVSIAFKRVLNDVKARSSSIRAGGLYDEYKKGFCQIFSDHKIPRQSLLTTDKDYFLDNDSLPRMNDSSSCLVVDKKEIKMTNGPVGTSPKNVNYLKALDNYIKLNRESSQNGGLKPYFLPNSKNRQLVWNEVPLLRPGTIPKKPQKLKISVTSSKEKVSSGKEPGKATQIVLNIEKTAPKPETNLGKPPGKTVYKSEEPPPKTVLKIEEPAPKTVYKIEEPPPKTVYKGEEPPPKTVKMKIEEPTPKTVYKVEEPPPKIVKMKIEEPPPKTVYKGEEPPPKTVKMKIEEPPPKTVKTKIEEPPPKTVKMKIEEPPPKTEPKVEETQPSQSVGKTIMLSPNNSTWQEIFSGIDPKQLISGMKAIKHSAFSNMFDEYQNQIEVLNKALKTKQNLWKDVVDKGKTPVKSKIKRNSVLNPPGRSPVVPFPDILVNHAPQVGTTSMIDNMANQMSLSPLEMAQRIVGTGQNVGDPRLRIVPNQMQPINQFGVCPKSPEILYQAPCQIQPDPRYQQLEGGMSPILDKILQRLETIQATKGNQSDGEDRNLPCCFSDPAAGAPCDLNGSWESLYLGVRINIQSPSTAVMETEKAKLPCYNPTRDKSHHRRMRRTCVKINNNMLKEKSDMQHASSIGIPLNISVQETVPPRAHNILDNISDWVFSGHAVMVLGGPLSLSFRQTKTSTIGHFVGYCRTCGCVDTIFGSWTFCQPSRDCQDITMSIVDRRDMLRRYSMDERRKNRFKERLYLHSKFAKMEKQRLHDEQEKYKRNEAPNSKSQVKT